MQLHRPTAHRDMRASYLFMPQPVAGHGSQLCVHRPQQAAKHRASLRHPTAAAVTALVT